jgi:hypothetical protein
MNLCFRCAFVFSPKPLKGLPFVIARLREAILLIRITTFGQDCFVPRNDVKPILSPFRACPELVSGGLNQKAINA